MKWQEGGKNYVGLHNSYSSPKIIKTIKLRQSWVGHVAWMGEVKNAYNILVGKLEEKRTLRRHRHRWEHNIKMDLRVGGYGLHSSGSGQRLWSAPVNTAMNLQVP
jgi:hypothetical protein